MNKLVMNYLVIEGFKDAAEKFQKESGTDPGIDLGTISDRMIIRNAIQAGDIETGIERANDLNPEILDSNGPLFFHLQQQKLIELIRKGQIDEALDFAQEELSQQGQENPKFLEELERTMALFAFDGIDQSSSPVGDLLATSQRQKIASELNAAILMNQCQETDPRLPTLLKMLQWGQTSIEDRVKFPHITNLTTAEFDDLKEDH
eukprot:TRINITY_DN6749_c0_g1_i2.p1 TRINITY_DN6749_c0_g1~~TRINITY_DN6749_c0_g1_i2.p1  ORF type:complete len:205 (-),score=70.03 TRINITY_DN6749_c0_g1_i2:43-657(-)